MLVAFVHVMHLQYEWEEGGGEFVLAFLCWRIVSASGAVLPIGGSTTAEGRAAAPRANKLEARTIVRPRPFPARPPVRARPLEDWELTRSSRVQVGHAIPVASLLKPPRGMPNRKSGPEPRQRRTQATKPAACGSLELRPESRARSDIDWVRLMFRLHRMCREITPRPPIIWLIFGRRLAHWPK